MIEEDEEEKDVSEVNCVKSESTQSSLVIIAFFLYRRIISQIRDDEFFSGVARCTVRENHNATCDTHNRRRFPDSMMTW